MPDVEGESVLSRSVIAAGRGGLIVALLLSSACVHYVPRPLSLPANAERLDARTLTDEGLAGAIQSSSPQQVWPPAVWDLPALTIAALYYHPDLEIARANWALARAGLISAGARPNPIVAAGPGYNSSTPAQTITPWILSLDLDFMNLPPSRR